VNGYENLKEDRIPPGTPIDQVRGEGPKPCAAWGASEDGDPARDQSQKLLASLENSSDANCDAQQMAGEPWTSFAQTTLVRPCDPFGAELRRNRTLSMDAGRTRMSGGVGRAVSDGGPYPISVPFPRGVTISGFWRHAKGNGKIIYST